MTYWLNSGNLSQKSPIFLNYLAKSILKIITPVQDASVEAAERVPLPLSGNDHHQRQPDAPDLLERRVHPGIDLTKLLFGRKTFPKTFHPQMSHNFHHPTPRNEYYGL
jgi:hypothetical protein